MKINLGNFVHFNGTAVKIEYLTNLELKDCNNKFACFDKSSISSSVKSITSSRAGCPCFAFASMCTRFLIISFNHNLDPNILTQFDLYLTHTLCLIWMTPGSCSHASPSTWIGIGSPSNIVTRTEEHCAILWLRVESTIVLPGPRYRTSSGATVRLSMREHEN